MTTTEQGGLTEYLERQRAEAAYFTVRDTARWLGLSEATVRRRIADGSLPTLRLRPGGAVRIPRAAVESPARAPRTGLSPAVEAPAHGGSTREEER